LNLNIISSKKLQILREKIETEKRNEKSFPKIKNDNKNNSQSNNYKERLSRVREKSQEQASSYKNNDLVSEKSKTNNLLIKKQNLKLVTDGEMTISRGAQIQINKQDQNNDSNEINFNIDKTKFDIEHENIISMLNSSRSTKEKNNILNVLKQSSSRDDSVTISKLEEIYDDNLLNLIYDIENGSMMSKKQECIKQIGIDTQKDKQ
jgi:hypothetical protein